MHPQDFLSLFHGFIFFLLYGSSTAQRRGIGRGGNQVVDFDCPEEFGYYPHPTDCTQYYVCVFGGALLESCTGGLMYSHELQTCDWPRNVGCGAGNGDAGTISTIRVTDPRTKSPPQQRTSSTPQQSLQSQQGRISQREEAHRQRQNQDVQRQQPQQIVYEDELGPAEEVENDRQQRVYRGQPSTLGQVQRDRDGLRPLKNAIQVPNVIPSGPGTAEKISLVSYNSQRVSQPRQQDQYSDILTENYGNLTWLTDNYLELPTDVLHSRRKRQAPYRLGGSGRTSQLANAGQRTRKIPIILIPDKSQTQYAHSQRNQFFPNPSFTMYGQTPRTPNRAPTSYSSQNNDNFHIVHNFGNSAPNEVKYSSPDYSQPVNSFDQPSESHHVYEHKFPPQKQYSHPAVEIGYQSGPFRPQSLFGPANNSRPDLDLVKLTKETIQSAFRPVRPPAVRYENKYHLPQQTPVPQTFFQAFFGASRPMQEEFTLVPSTTPQAIILESATKNAEIYNFRQVAVATLKPETNLFRFESTVEAPLHTTDAPSGPTRFPLFEVTTSGKRKRKKTTTNSAPTVPAVSAATTSHYDYNVTFFSFSEPDYITDPPKLPITYTIKPSTSTTTERPTTSTSTTTLRTTTQRKKPVRQKPTTTTVATTTTASTTPRIPPKKIIPEEYYENFKPFPTHAALVSSTNLKRQRHRLKPTMMTTLKEDKTTVVSHMTRGGMKNVRVEPAQEFVATTASAPVRYNTSSRYQQPGQYDQYYQLYEEDDNLYRGNQYTQQQQPQQQQQVVSVSSTARSPVQQYRGQSSFKQQSVQIEPQRDTYAQDVYSEDQASQDYNDQDEQQYQELASPKPTRSEDEQENRRRDTLSASSIARPFVTNETAKRPENFDPAILAPPPRIPSSFLTPPNNDEKSYYIEHLPLIKNKEVLIPPKNGGALSKSYNNFDTVLSSFFNAVTQTRFDDKAAPQTILRSEFGKISHEPIVDKASKTKQPVAYQELPEKDFQTFFVEIEPKRTKTQSGFFITKPQEGTESSIGEIEPAVEITRGELVNPESQEISYSPKSRPDSIGRLPPPPPPPPVVSRVPKEFRAVVDPNVDVLPQRGPAARFNPYLEEIEYLNYYKKPSTKTTTTSTTTTTTTTTTTSRPILVQEEDEQPELIKDPKPYQFIIVSTETPTPFARNPDNEFRTEHRLAFRPEIRAKNKFSESLANVRPTVEDEEFRINYAQPQKEPEVRYTSRYAATTESSSSNEATKQFESSEESEPLPNRSKEITLKTAVGRSKSSREEVDTTPVKPKTRLRIKPQQVSAETTADPSSFERSKLYSSSEESVSHRYGDQYGSSYESTEAPVSAEVAKSYSSGESVDPIRQEDAGVFLEEEPAITTKKPAIRVRTTTAAPEIESRKPSRKIVKLHKGELRNQRLGGSKIKRVRKPSTQTPVIDDVDDDKAYTRENDVHSTLRPIIVGEDLDVDKNATQFRFTVEDDAGFSIMPKNKAHLFETKEELRVVRPAYQPINLDTLESAEEPIPSKPSTEPPTPKPSTTYKNPDHDRTTAKPSRGRSSLKPRLRTTTVSPDFQTSLPQTPVRQRGGSSFNLGVGNDISQSVNRGTPAPSRGTRPTLKPSTAIVSKASEFIDIYRFPPSRPENLYATPIPDKSAAKCRKDVCLLPDCSCGGKEIPGGYNAEEIPQLVLLTFDDSVNDLNKGLYADLFERGRVNPNGCPISGTFYVSHEWTDYAQVQNLYANGHEMASHSVSHSFGEQFSQKKWTREVAGQREILSAYGGVRLEDIRGMRAPFLAVGGNKMFKMLYDANFTYDSSMPIYENKPPSWPYTLDYKLFHDCMIPPCPTKSYPGVWEVPMVMWQDLNGGRCSMGDACSNPPTADGVYKMLIKNFERHFTTNRAPFGLFYHAAWFTHEHHKEGFIAFLDTIVNMPEVWLVTNWQALQWVRDPQPLSTVNNFPAFQCNEEKAKKCNNPKVCNLWHKSGVRYMRTCQPCPDVYPWTGKTGVRNSRVDNEIIDE